MQIDTEKYLKYKCTLKGIKDAKPHEYNTFKKMVEDLQKRATRALES